MKAITLYEANDGVRFELECDCVYHEAFCDKVEEINKRLRKNEEIDGTLAIEQDLDVVKSAFKDLMELCAEEFPQLDGRVFKEVATGKRHISHADYLLQEYSDHYPTLRRLFYRFLCIDMNTGIEYEQSYFAQYPQDFKGKVLKLNQLF